MESIEELKLTGKLPSPPGVGMTILELTRSDDFSIDEVARAIQSDPALTGRVLKLTNSSRNAAIQPITTVEEAVNRLGMSTLRGVALGFSLVASYREGACKAFDFSDFWSESLLCALAAQHVAETLGRSNPSEAYICGLLNRIGMLGLACVHPVAYAEILTNEDDEDLLAAEFQAFAVNHSQLGKAMLLDWGMPEGLARVLALCKPGADFSAETKSTVELVEVLQIARPIARVCFKAEACSESDRRALENALAQSGMKTTEFQALCEQVGESWQEWGAILKLATHEVPSFDLLGAGLAPEIVTGGNDVALGTIVESSLDPDVVLRVLIVDEDAISIGILSKTISDSNHEVMSCREGDKALGTILESLPDIVICSATLSSTSGLELVQILRGCPEGRQIYFVLLSADDSEQAELGAYAAGVDDFMLKPFHPDLVRAHIDAGARLVELKRQIQRAKSKLETQVAEMAILNRKLTKASLTDPLTDLPNRRSAMDTVKQKWAEGSRVEGSQVALMILDIDNFKAVNDNYGHDVGDEVLKSTARVFATQARLEESVARIGGEEFLVVCGLSSSKTAEDCAERLRAAVEANHVTFGDFDTNVTVSIGVAFANPALQDYESTLKAADEALYVAKESGRNQVHVVRPGALV